jgi:hypothetical protein
MHPSFSGKNTSAGIKPKTAHEKPAFSSGMIAPIHALFKIFLLSLMLPQRKTSTPAPRLPRKRGNLKKKRKQCVTSINCALSM